ncbi:MAG: shikimate dehydrogenase [Chitinivibrionales bacterium]
MERISINGGTRLTGLIGNPVEHSVSPLIHNHLFSVLNLNYAYIPFKCDPDYLGAAVAGLKSVGFAGCNVTIPYKSEIIRYCDEISELSEITGTVNTLYYKEGRLCGTTTDFAGFKRAAEELCGSLADKEVVIIGNGGTARTIGICLSRDNEIRSLSIAGRNIRKVEDLCRVIQDKTGRSVDPYVLNQESTSENIREYDLIVNCTPVGMHPNTGVSPVDRDALTQGQFVFDAVYNPLKTKLISDAEIRGVEAVNGLKMLLYQGLESFHYWTGVRPDPGLLDMHEIEEIITGKV